MVSNCYSDIDWNGFDLIDLFHPQTSSNMDLNKYKPEYGMDGNSKTCCHTLDGVGQWWAAKFSGGIFYVTMVKLQNRGNGLGYRLGSS